MTENARFEGSRPKSARILDSRWGGGSHQSKVGRVESNGHYSLGTCTVSGSRGMGYSLGQSGGAFFRRTFQKEVVLGALYQHEQAAADKEEEEEEEHVQSEEEKRAALLASTASYWWRWVYPALRARGAELGMVECVQHPGKMIYVPQGW